MVHHTVILRHSNTSPNRSTATVTPLEVKPFPEIWHFWQFERHLVAQLNNTNRKTRPLSLLATPRIHHRSDTRTPAHIPSSQPLIPNNHNPRISNTFLPKPTFTHLMCSRQTDNRRRQPTRPLHRLDQRILPHALTSGRRDRHGRHRWIRFLVVVYAGAFEHGRGSARGGFANGHGDVVMVRGE